MAAPAKNLWQWIAGVALVLLTGALLAVAVEAYSAAALAAEARTDAADVRREAKEACAAAKAEAAVRYFPATDGAVLQANQRRMMQDLHEIKEALKEVVQEVRAR